MSACGGSGSGSTEEEGYDPTSTSIISRCYHGSTCKRSSNDVHYCDCENINAQTSSTGNKYAGLMCEHEATSMCAVSLVEEYAPNGQFCTNHGSCVKLVTGSDPHPGCVCREGYTGDRCELKIGQLDIIPKLMSGEGGEGSAAGKWVLFTLLVVLMLGVGTSVVYLLIKIRKEQAMPAKKKTLGKTSAEVGLGDIEPDGSGTLGMDLESRAEVEEGIGGDLEMKEDISGDGEEADGGTKDSSPAQEDDHSDGQQEESLTIGEKNESFVIT